MARGARRACPDAAAKLRSPRWRAFAELCGEIAGLPRHISQHPGGMVISSRPLVELVPVQPAAMAGPPDLPVGQGLMRRRGLPEDRPARARDALRGRGAASTHRRAQPRRADRPLARPARRPGRLRGDPARRHRRRLPDREPRADAEHPAHAAGEPRRPHVQVALVRPGPIQGKAVHPYIERRQRLREDPGLRAARRPPAAAPSRCARRSASSSSRTRCSTWRSRSPASPSARPKGCGGR